MDFGGILIDYHLIFMMVSLLLLFLPIILVWLVNTKQSCIVSVFFLGLNQMFIVITEIGFLGIGLFGYNTATGNTEVMLYSGLNMFQIMFMALLWINGLLLLIAIIKYNRFVFQEKQERYKIQEYADSY